MILLKFIVFNVLLMSSIAGQERSSILLPKDMEDHHRSLIEYIGNLFCSERSRQTFHIYTEGSVSTAFTNGIIKQLNECIQAGVLTSKYNFNDTRNFAIPYPSFSYGRQKQIITTSIDVNSLNIVQNINKMDIRPQKVNVPQKGRKYDFVLCAEPLFKSADRRLIEIFEELWKSNSINTVIVYWNRTVNAATYTPFRKQKLIFIRGSELNNIKRTMENKVNNLHGHSLKVTAFFDESRLTFDKSNINNVTALNGADGVLGRLLLERMNATLNMSIPKDDQEIGELYRNGSSSGCLGALVYGEADIGLNIRFYRLNQFEGKVEATIANGRDDICFLVPRHGKSADIANIFRPFSFELWIAFVVTVLCYPIVFSVFAVRDKHRRSFFHNLLQFFAYVLQQPGNFSIKNHIQKFLVCIWMFSGLYITYMYQGKLSGTLIIPKDAPNFNTFEQLASSDLIFYSLERYNRQIAQFFRAERYKRKLEPIIERMVNVSLKQLYEKIRERNSSLAFANKYHINNHIKRKLTENSNIFYHQVEKCPIPYVAVYGLGYGSVYKARIDSILRRTQESGLIEFWDRDLKMKEQITQSKLHARHGNVAFTLEHLQTAFYVYCLGLIVALVIFVSEHCWNNCCCCRKMMFCFKNEIKSTNE